MHTKNIIKEVIGDVKMINFIIVDDNPKFLEILSHVVDKAMFNTNYEYKKYVFNEYDYSFLSMTDKQIENKIYILDIETPKVNGVDIAYDIRQKDLDSNIIFISAHEDKYGDKLLKSTIKFFYFVSKKDDYKKKISSVIDTILNEPSTKIFEINDGQKVCRFPEKNILHFETYDRKTSIVTDYGTFYVNKTLTEIEKKLEYPFIRTHKSCIINSSRILEYNSKKRYIIFNDENVTTTYLVSRKYKSNLEICLCKQ